MVAALAHYVLLGAAGEDSGELATKDEQAEALAGDGGLGARCGNVLLDEGHHLPDVARDALAISKAGLKARNRLNDQGEDETIFLQTLEDVIGRKTTMAEDMLAIYNGRWNGSVEPVFDEYSY